VIWEIASDRWTNDPTLAAARGLRAAARAGLQRALPVTLVVTFLLVPSTATKIFKTFLCDPFEFDPAANTTRSYLHNDLALSCESDEYVATENLAYAMLFVWPVGVPLLYAILLWASRDALLSGKPTSLSRATAFLSADYETPLSGGSRSRCAGSSR